MNASGNTVICRLFGLALAVCLSAMSACASSGSTTSKDVPGSNGGFTGATEVTTVEGAAKAERGGVSADYKVGPQDLLEISVFQVADLNRTVRVNTGGEISLPLIGVVQAGGRTVQQVQDDIAHKLTEKYLQNPQVSVFVKEFTSQRVTLEGAVAKPGIYPLTGQTSLLQTIAMAGGLNDMADLQGVVVFRVIGGTKKAARFDLKQIRKGSAEDPVIYGDDIVVVEESGSKSMFSRIIKSMPVLGVFSFF